MDLNLRNNVELNQKLTLTPQLQQSIRILQMSGPELTEYAQQLTLENPVMEIEPHYEELERHEKLQKKLEWLEETDEENRIYYQSAPDREEYQFSVVSGEQDTLTYHLLYQLDLLSLPASEHTIAKYIIQSLNENGYLETDLKEIASSLHIGMDEAEKALKLVQSFEPWGVAARNLKECLLIQLKHKGITNPFVFDIVNHYLEELGKNKLNVIAKELKLSVDEVKKLYNMIKSLNPHPGSSYNSVQQTRYITADIIVVKFKDYYEVLLNDFAYPRISISKFYKNTFSYTSDAQTKEYIHKKIDQASWIMKCIEQRNNTILNVVKSIVEIQKSFFDKGPGHLVPLVLTDIADKLSIHESTVSRAVHDKYLQCSWGIFELKYFFSTGVSTTSADDTTAENIKIAMKDLIEHEDKKKPYSDQKITNLLHEKGIRLSRRTVAKYRDEMGIPAASLRKEF